MRDIRFVLSRWGMCCGSESQRGTVVWFDVVGGWERLAPRVECGSWRVGRSCS